MPLPEVKYPTRVDQDVPQAPVAFTVAHIAQLLGTGAAQAHAGSPLQAADTMLVFSVHGESCISDTFASVRLVA